MDKPPLKADDALQTRLSVSGPERAFMTNPTTIERAFALARSGTCASVNDIRQRLREERFEQVDAYLTGPSLGRQLRALCQEAQRP